MSDQDGVLVGHISFQEKKKIICSSETWGNGCVSLDSYSILSVCHQ